MTHLHAEPVVTVACVDDNELVAEAVGRRLVSDTSIRWVGHIAADANIESCLVDLQPNVLLMDIDMPDIDTFALVERIATRLPNVRVLMFSGYVDVTYIGRALDCGAWGYVSKNEDARVLVECIKRAARGEVVLSTEVELVQQRSHKGHQGVPPTETGRG